MAGMYVIQTHICGVRRIGIERRMAKEFEPIRAGEVSIKQFLYSVRREVEKTKILVSITIPDISESEDARTATTTSTTFIKVEKISEINEELEHVIRGTSVNLYSVLIQVTNDLSCHKSKRKRKRRRRRSCVEAWERSRLVLHTVFIYSMYCTVQYGGYSLYSHLLLFPSAKASQPASSGPSPDFFSISFERHQNFNLWKAHSHPGLHPGVVSNTKTPLLSSTQGTESARATPAQKPPLALYLRSKRTCCSSPAAS